MLGHFRDRLASPEFRAELKSAAIAFVITSLLFGSSLLSLLLAFVAQSASLYRVAEVFFILSLALAAIGGVYIVPKLARRVRLELSRLDISYAPTQETAFFVLLTVVVALSAFNTGNNLLYLIFAILISVIVASGIVSEAMLRGLIVGLRFPEHIHVKQVALLEVSITNEKYLVPSMSLTVGVRLLQKAGPQITDQAPATKRRWRWSGKPQNNSQNTSQSKAETTATKLDNLAHFVIVGPRTKVRQTIEHQFPARGQYEITGFTVTTKFPFGFLQKTCRFAASGTIVVFPAVDAAISVPKALSEALGARETNRRGLGADLYAIRQYRDGDRQRDIDWKATAKTRRLMVRDRLREDERRITVRFDPRPTHDLSDSELAAFENGVNQATSLLSRLVKSGVLVRLVTPESTTEFGNTQRHLHDMLRILAVVEAQPEEKAARVTPKLEAREPAPEIIFAWNDVPASGPVLARIAFDNLRLEDHPKLDNDVK
ncbi:MAG: DUF58 domain-containing protein [Acidobacteriota bacterium]